MSGWWFLGEAVSGGNMSTRVEMTVSPCSLTTHIGHYSAIIEINSLLETRRTSVSDHLRGFDGQHVERRPGLYGWSRQRVRPP